MGLFSFTPKKPASSAGHMKATDNALHKYDHNSRGKITARELPYVERRLIAQIGHLKTERVMEHLQANMDSDGQFGGANVSKKEVDTLIKTLDRSQHSNFSDTDLRKAREVLEGYE